MAHGTVKPLRNTSSLAQFATAAQTACVPTWSISTSLKRKQLERCTAQLRLCEMVQLHSLNEPQVSKLGRCADATRH